MVGTPDLNKLLTCTTKGRAKVVLVGDAHQLSPVNARAACSSNSAPTCRGAKDSGGMADGRPRGARRVAGSARRTRQ